MKHDLRAYTLQMLDISTAHVPQSTALALDEASCNQRGELWDSLAFVNWGEYGWIFHADEDFNLDDYPELARVLRFANEQGFIYLRLDRDADPLPEEMLPVFDW